jgi:maltose O-acetyltransferase
MASSVLRVAGLDLGACAISSGCYFGGTSISIGDGTFINVGVMLDASAPIRIGRKCIVAMRVLICTSSHETGTPDHFVDRPTRAGVTIGDGCWLGAGSLVMPGVTIGANCVVAAGAVVVKDCAPNGLYGGVPAKRIREI